MQISDHFVDMLGFTSFWGQQPSMIADIQTFLFYMWILQIHILRASSVVSIFLMLMWCCLQLH